MSFLQRRWRAVFFTLLICAGLPLRVQAAEPLTMLLHVLQQQLASAAEAALAAPSRPEPPAEKMTAIPGVHGVTAEQLRVMIDIGFVHLTAAQRDEVYKKLMDMLTDPRHAAARPLIIQELAQKAAATRATHERLSELSSSQKREIAEQTRLELERLSPEQRDQVIQLLRSRTSPIPRDLNDLILAEVAASGTPRPAPQP